MSMPSVLSPSAPYAPTGSPPPALIARSVESIAEETASRPTAKRELLLLPLVLLVLLLLLPLTGAALEYAPMPPAVAPITPDSPKRLPLLLLLNTAAAPRPTIPSPPELLLLLLLENPTS